MRRTRLFWRLYPSILLLLLFVLLAAAGNSWWSLRQFDRTQSAAGLEARARLMLRLVAAPLSNGDFAHVDALCKSAGQQTATGYTVLLPSGQVVGDSAQDPRSLENQRSSPEVVAALAGQTGMAVRQEDAARGEMIYAAVTVRQGSRLLGVLRAAQPLTTMGQAVWMVFSPPALALEIALTAVVLLLIIARWINRPLAELKRGAECFAEGDLTARLAVQDTGEFDELAKAMNRMALQCDTRIRTIVRQSNEQDVMLMSMLEGVLAVDGEERVLRLNKSAGLLLGVDPQRAIGRSLQEAIRNSDLQRFVAQVLASQEPREDEVVLWGSGECIMQLHGTVLRDEQARSMGALVVMNDVTHLRRLERVRRDFVANVSHELKTPITSIRGFVETLLDGVDDPADTRRFLEIIIKHSDRLQAIIDDLLLLSRVEQQTERAEITLEHADIHGVLQSAIDAMAMKAEEKKMTIERSGAASVIARVNVNLLEQAGINLLDNAIKYSEPGRTIRVSLEEVGMETLIIVQDQGYGIPHEALPRLFERFYRVDTGRSRKQGGTGLGLAIVKHIAQAHHGNVTVESTPGIGSTFTIHLPRDN